MPSLQPPSFAREVVRQTTEEEVLKQQRERRKPKSRLMRTLRRPAMKRMGSSGSAKTLVQLVRPVVEQAVNYLTIAKRRAHPQAVRPTAQRYPSWISSISRNPQTPWSPSLSGVTPSLEGMKEEEKGDSYFPQSAVFPDER